MSRQSESKERQGYVSKAVPTTCMNCVNFAVDMVEREYRVFSQTRTFQEEKNMRCAIGGFKVMKMASCNEFKLKVSE